MRYKEVYAGPTRRGNGNKDYMRVRNKLFLYYGDFTFLFVKNTVTGKEACTTTKLVNLEEDQGSSDNNIIDMTTPSAIGREIENHHFATEHTLRTSHGTTSSGKKTRSGSTPITSKKKKLVTDADWMHLMEHMLAFQKHKNVTTNGC